MSRMSSNSRDNDREVDPPMSRLFVICNKDNSGNFIFNFLTIL